MKALLLLSLSLVACQSQNVAVAAKPNTLTSICSALSFSQSTLPITLSPFQVLGLELALNISGSFEGAEGWANLTNNFDGQGLSMGLLNQNLGQGSLQPLLIQMRDQHLSTLQSIFSAADLTSLLKMLSQWQTDEANLKVQKTRLSTKDIPTDTSTEDTAESTSVQWAVANLYSGSNFIRTWQNELTALGNNPQFVSIQIAAALALHTQAVADIQPIGVNELRTYLFVFDIEAQDGGFYVQDLTNYAAWVAANTMSTDDQKLVELLNLRLQHVQSQYVADVQSRKLAIINGSGVVHGEARNLESQYCFNRLATYLNN